MRVDLSLSLMRRFMRSRSLAGSTVIMAVTAALLVGMFVTLQAFTLSSAQVVERDLGRYTFLSDLSRFSTVDPGDKHAIDVLARAAESAGAAETSVSLTAFDVRPAIFDAPQTMYIESNWDDHPYPDRYSLLDGRWPKRPGEVVVTESLQESVGEKDRLSVLAGNERFHVVGVAYDHFEGASRILAADGTWDSFGSATRRNFADLSATAELRWSGGDTDRVIDAVSTALSTSTAVDSALPDNARQAIAQDLSTNLRSRDGELALEQRSWVDRLPIAYQIPSLALPPLSVLAIFGLNTRRLRKSLGILTSIGVSRRQASAGAALATGAWTMIAAGLGAVVGIGLGAVSRPIVDAFLAGPISPFPAIGAPLLRLVAVTAASCLISALILHLTAPQLHSARTTLPRRSVPKPASPPQPRTGRARTVRQVLAVVAVVATVVQVPALDAPLEAMILAATFAAAILLFTPELVSTAIRLLPGSEPRIRLGREQLRSDQVRAVVSVTVLTAALGPPLALLTLLITWITSIQEDTDPLVAPHQVELTTDSLTAPPPQQLVDAITGQVDFQEPPIQVGYLSHDDKLVRLRGTDIGAVLMVDTVAEVARLNNGHLTKAQAQTLRDGGMLIWDHGRRGPQVLVTIDGRTGQILSSTDSLPAAPSDFEPAWQGSTTGLLLTRTAQELGLPMSRSDVVFTNVPDAQAAAAEQAALDAHMDPRFVRIYEPPEPVDVPPVFYTAIVGLGLVVLLTTMAVARTQVITLRGYLGRLISVGLSQRWVRHVLLIQCAVVIGLSTVLALLIAVPPVIVAVLRLPDFTLDIPWLWIGLIVGAFYLSTVAATLLSSQRIRATDRLKH